MHSTWSRVYAPVLVAALGVSVVSADEAEDRRTCGNRRQDPDQRIAACTRLIDAETLPPEDKSWALVERGHALRLKDKDKEALADFSKAIELDSTNPVAYQSRARIHYAEKRYSAALADFDKAVALDPRDAWTVVARGDVQYVLKNDAAALADYGKALRLDPRRTSAHYGRAHIHLRAKDYAKALADANGALSLHAWDAKSYEVRGKIHEAMDRRDDAVRDFRIALLLDPNLDVPEAALARLAGTPPPPATGTVPFADPKPGLRMRFLVVLSPFTPRKSDMEEAILGLAGWFRGKQRPLPIEKSFVLRELVKAAGGDAELRATKNPDAEVERDREVEVGSVYRALWPRVLVGPQKQRLEIAVDAKTADALWPLTPGQKGAGESALEWVCPNPPDAFAKLLGCSSPGQRLSMGKAAWTYEVAGHERLVVAAGTFDTVKLVGTETMHVEILGKTISQPSKVTVWFAPSIGWWVKREREFDQDGPRLRVEEAVKIE